VARGIPESRLNITVSEDLLHGNQIDSSHDSSTRGGMPQRLPAGALNPSPTEIRCSNGWRRKRERGGVGGSSPSGRTTL